MTNAKVVALGIRLFCIWLAVYLLRHMPRLWSLATDHLPDVGAATAWDFTAAVPGKQFCFAVASYSAESEGGKSAAVCGFSDRLTLLSNPGPQATVVGQYTTLQIEGSDPDGLAAPRLNCSHR